MLTANNDGSDHNRSNDLCDRRDFRLFGQQTHTVGPSLRFAARIPGPLSEKEAAELVVEAFDYLSVASGYLDPTVAITAPRNELGVTTAN